MVKALRDQYGWNNEFDKQNLKDFARVAASMLGGPLSFGATVGKMIYGKSKEELEGMDSTEYKIAKAALDADKKAGVVNQAPVEERQGIPVEDIIGSGSKVTAEDTGTPGVSSTSPIAPQTKIEGTDLGPIGSTEPNITGGTYISGNYKPTTPMTGENYGVGANAMGPPTREASEQQTPSFGSDDDSDSDGALAKGGLISKRQHPAKKQKGKGIARSKK